MNVQGLPAPLSYGCCDFQLSTADETIICARSMEFPMPMNSTIHVHIRGEQCCSLAPDKSPGLSWVSKYGFVGINALGINDPDEGMNEKGLSFSFLSLNCSEYQTISENEKNRALGILDVGAWILGNFTDIDEVVEGLKNVRIWGNFINPLDEKVMGLHIALHDSMGRNLIIEFLKGEMIIQENPLGVLTNDPPFAYHMENLKQYNHLSPESASTIKINGQVIESSGLGSGMIGLPGDPSSISRFIQIAKRIQVATKVKKALEGVNLAAHILNCVDRVKGTTVLKIEDHILYETTLWCTIKDLTHKILFYRSYDDLTLRAICLGDLDFAGGKKYKAIPLSSHRQFAVDMTKELEEQNTICQKSYS